MHSTQFRNDEGRERMGKGGGRKKDEDKRWLERRKVGRKQLPMDRKGKSSLPGSIEAGRKDVREARHVLPSVKSIPVKERKTRESGPSLAVLLLFRFWVDRSITTKGTTVKSRSVHDVSLTICSLDNEALRFQVNGTGCEWFREKFYINYSTKRVVRNSFSASYGVSGFSFCLLPLLFVYSGKENV